MIRNFVMRNASRIASIAAVFGLFQASSTCRFLGHQPDEPRDLKEMLR